MTPSPEPPEPAEGPLVSVCIPTYNRAGMVGDAIRSALDQTYRNIEVVVVDNASTDGTEGVVASFSDPRLKYIRNERNLGLFGNCNRCIELARGKYIHILHSDDTIPPDFTATCVRFLEDHPEVAFTFTPAEVHASGHVTMVSRPPSDEILPPPEGFRRILTERSLIACPSVVMRKQIYEEVGPFSLEYPYSSDLSQWMKVALRHPIAHLAGTHLIYRQGSHSESFRLLFESPAGYLDVLKIYLRLIEDLAEEEPRFQHDLNDALFRYIGDCIFAQWTRSDRMVRFSPSVLTGFALSAWSMVKPGTPGEWAKKAGLIPVILATPLLRHVPLMPRLVKRVLARQYTVY